MANAAIFIRWGRPVVGRETKALEVFSQALELHASLKAKGKISSNATYIATTGELQRFSGCIVLEGEVAKLREVIDSDEWKTIHLKAEHCVDHVDVVHCITGDEVQKYVGKVVDVRRQLGITS